MLNNKLLKIGLIIGMIWSLMLAIICVTYETINIFSFFSPLSILVIIYGLLQIIPFLFCLNTYRYWERHLFITGLMALFAFVIPGVIILIGYFIKQKNMRGLPLS